MSDDHEEKTVTTAIDEPGTLITQPEVGPLGLAGVLGGSERFRCSEKPLGLTLLGFWKWSESDLLNSLTRTRLAEFIVATALGARAEGPRDERSSLELVTPDGIEVRVKSPQGGRPEGRGAMSADRTHNRMSSAGAGRLRCPAQHGFRG